MKFLSYDSRSNEKVNSGQIKVIWINHDNFKKWPRFGMHHPDGHLVRIPHEAE